MNPAIVIITLLCSICRAQQIRGPPRINHAEASAIVVVKAGDPLRLLCPVTASGSQHLIVQWSKDGEPVDETWPQFRISSRTLRVKTASVDMTGNYVCKGITGYGTAQHQMKLIVIDSTLNKQRAGSKVNRVPEENFPSLNSGKYRLKPPKITQVFPQRAVVVKMLGGRVRFKCVSTGFPRPQIQWLKNGESVEGSKFVDLSSPGQMAISRLTLSDTGVYACNATSVLGKDNHVFHLRVEDPSAQRPVIDSGDEASDKPSRSNRTVRLGDRLELECRVTGPPPMHVKWLRHVSSAATYPTDRPDRSDEVLLSTTNPSTDLDHSNYVVLNTSGPVRRITRDQYSRRLVLAPVQLSDSGQYTCLAANSGGLSVRHIHVEVFDPTVQGFVENPHSSYETKYLMYLTIVAPLAAVLLLACATFVLLRYKLQRSANTTNETISDAEASLVGTEKVFLHLPSESEQQKASIAPSVGDTSIFSLQIGHERRHHRDSRSSDGVEHTYTRLLGTSDRQLLGTGTSCSGSSSGSGLSDGTARCCQCRCSAYAWTQARAVSANSRHVQNYKQDFY